MSPSMRTSPVPRSRCRPRWVPVPFPRGTGRAPAYSHPIRCPHPGRAGAPGRQPYASCLKKVLLYVSTSPVFRAVLGTGGGEVTGTGAGRGGGGCCSPGPGGPGAVLPGFGRRREARGGGAVPRGRGAGVP